MRIQRPTLAIAALLGFRLRSCRDEHAFRRSGPTGYDRGRPNRATEKLDNNKTIMAEIVEISGMPPKWRLGTTLWPRESPADSLNVGDALELGQTIEPRQR